MYQPARIKNDEAKSLFASHDADVAVVVAYGRILPNEFLQAPRRGCINVHFSLLPLYRGAAPANWAIVNGETETGVTTMFIEPTLDTGPILLQSKTEIGETRDCAGVDGTAGRYWRQACSAKHSLDLDELTPRPQNDRRRDLCSDSEERRWSDRLVAKRFHVLTVASEAFSHGPMLTRAFIQRA